MNDGDIYKSTKKCRSGRIALIILIMATAIAGCGDNPVVEKVKEALPLPSNPIEILSNRVGTCESESVSDPYDDYSWWDFRFAPDFSSAQFHTELQSIGDGTLETVRLSELSGQTIKISGGGEGEIFSIFSSSGTGSEPQIELTWSEENGTFRLGDIGGPTTLDRGWFEADAASFKGGEAEVRFMVERNGETITNSTLACRLTGYVEPTEDGAFNIDDCSLEVRESDGQDRWPAIVGCGRVVGVLEATLSAEMNQSGWTHRGLVQTPPIETVELDVNGCDVQVGDRVPIVGAQAYNVTNTELGLRFEHYVTVLQSADAAKGVAAGRNSIMQSLAEGCDPMEFPNGSLHELALHEFAPKLFSREVSKVDHSLPDGAMAWETHGKVVVLLQSGPYYGELWFNESDINGGIGSFEGQIIDLALQRMSGKS